MLASGRVLASECGECMSRSFDIGSISSPLYQFIAREFNARGTDLRKKLGTKDHGGALAASLGIRVAKQIFSSHTPELPTGSDMPKRYALKYAHGWSARGIMLLQETDAPGYMFEHLSQRLLHHDEILSRQVRTAESFPHKPNEWLCEEWLQGVTPGEVPFDYKFYTFRDRVGLIVQIDRNTYPVKIALFDGGFSPLRPNIDYLISGNAQHGQHLLPKHPLSLLYSAVLLAQQTDSPFVSIDMFDTPEGPAFGEFTFSPGGMHKRLWKLSAEVISMLDAHYSSYDSTIDYFSWHTEHSAHPLSSQQIAQIAPEQLALLEDIPELLYENWSKYLYNGGSRGAARAADFFLERAGHFSNGDEASVVSALGHRWRGLAVREDAAE